MGALEAAVHHACRDAGVDARLYELVKIRASQINGCAFCLDMHTNDARAAGESEQRIYTLSAWRETSFYTEPERAALALTEELTLVSEHGVRDEVFEQARKHFDDQQVAALVWAVVAINAWNRMAIATGSPEPGSYRPSSG
jgi:AhpD family alkylhydroperoxidase